MWLCSVHIHMYRHCVHSKGWGSTISWILFITARRTWLPSLVSKSPLFVPMFSPLLSGFLPLKPDSPPWKPDSPPWKPDSPPWKPDSPPWKPDSPPWKPDSPSPWSLDNPLFSTLTWLPWSRDGSPRGGTTQERTKPAQTAGLMPAHQQSFLFLWAIV